MILQAVIEIPFGTNIKYEYVFYRSIKGRIKENCKIRMLNT